MSNPTHDAWPWPLVKQTLRLLHSWWRRDAIRVSPAEGRLLRLEPSCYLLIRGLPVEVLGRVVQEGEAGPVVIYPCWTGSSLGQLTVEPRASCHRWQLQDRLANVAEAEIEVFGNDATVRAATVRERFDVR